MEMRSTNSFHSPPSNKILNNKMRIGNPQKRKRKKEVQVDGAPQQNEMDQVTSTLLGGNFFEGGNSSNHPKKNNFF
jgi:hypothetical protein